MLEITGLQVELHVDGVLRPIVREVGFSVGPGEAVGLVGESGSGKSMTMRAIMRLLPPRARVHGRVQFDGRDVLSMDPTALRDYRRCEVAMIHQDPLASINPVRTIGDFLTEGMRAGGTPGAEAYERAIDLMRQVLMPDPAAVVQCYPHELSGGMLQRVMIAAALASSPRLLLADEPTTALDATVQAEVVGILSELQRNKQMAMIFVTHDLELAGAICDRIVVMYAGSIVEDQPAARLMHAPLHPYTDALLRSRPDVTQTLPRIAVIPGRPIAAFEAGVGCSFAGRCPHVERACTEQAQEMTPLAGGSVACRRASELRRSNSAEVMS